LARPFAVARNWQLWAISTAMHTRTMYFTNPAPAKWRHGISQQRFDWQRRWTNTSTGVEFDRRSGFQSRWPSRLCAVHFPYGPNSSRVSSWDNGDGNPDYLLYNLATRETAIWYLNSNIHTGTAMAQLFRQAGAWLGLEQPLSETSSVQHVVSESEDKALAHRRACDLSFVKRERLKFNCCRYFQRRSTKAI
jgi:hypothetical protein